MDTSSSHSDRPAAQGEIVALMASMRARTRGALGIDDEISALRGPHRVEATTPPSMGVMVDGERRPLEDVSTYQCGWQIPIHQHGDLIALVYIPQRARCITSDMIELR